MQPVPVRDIYKLEFDLFQNGGWVLFYLFSTLMFLLHAFWGWEKLIASTAWNIPKAQLSKVNMLGRIIFAFIALCYFSFPLYCYLVRLLRGEGLGILIYWGGGESIDIRNTTRNNPITNGHHQWRVYKNLLFQIELLYTLNALW